MAFFEALKVSLAKEGGGHSYEKNDVFSRVNMTLKVVHSPGSLSNSSQDSGYSRSVHHDDQCMESVVVGVLEGDVEDDGFLLSLENELTWPPCPTGISGSDSESESEEEEVPTRNCSAMCRYVKEGLETFWQVPEGSKSRLDGEYLPEFVGEVMQQTQRAIREMEIQLERTTAELKKLSDRTGMPITQENGQRRYGPPVGESFVPTKGSEVFVGKLPRDCIETEIVPVFEQVGKIYEVRLMMDFSGTNRGYCFVQYFSPADAARAVKELNQFEIRKGRLIGVTKSVDNCRLFVGGIPKEKTRSEIFDEINKITDGVVRVIAYPSIKDRSENRGFAFVEYESHKAAAMARRKMIPGKIQMWGTDVAVDWAEPEPDVDIEIMKKVKALYVRNLMISTSEETLRDVFNTASGNAVERVRKMKDYGFVHFLYREAAEIAKDSLNHTEIEGSRIEIMWAKPVDKRVYQERKALARVLYSPCPGNNVGNGYMNMNHNQPVGYRNNFFYSNNSYAGTSGMIQNQYQGYPTGVENSVALQNGGGVYPAQQFGGDPRTMEYSGYQSYQQFGASAGVQHPITLMPSPAAQPVMNFDPSVLEQFHRMSLANEYRPFRGRAAGGVQGMRFPNNNRQFSPQNYYLQYHQSPMTMSGY